MVDITITAANVVPSDNVSTVTGIAGETIAQGKAVYRNSTSGKWMLADSNGATLEGRIAGGVALTGSSLNQPIVIQKAGDITIGATLTAGTAYYLSDSPGGICPVADVGSGENVCLIGMAKTTAILSVNIQTPGVVL